MITKIKVSTEAGKGVENVYNSFFNPYQQPVYHPYQQQQPDGDGRIWVIGEAGAKSYLVAPGATVALWDSEPQTIYLKSVSAAGMPSIQALSYSFKEAKAPAEYVTRDEFEKRLNEILKGEKTDVQ